MVKFLIVILIIMAVLLILIAGAEVGMLIWIMIDDIKEYKKEREIQKMIDKFNGKK